MNKYYEAPEVVQKWQAVILTASLVLVSFLPTFSFVGVTTASAETVGDLSPIAEGNYTEWDKAGESEAATKILSVETNDGDTTYIKTSNDTFRQSFTFEDVIVPDGSIVDSVTIYVIARRDGSNATEPDLRFLAEKGNGAGNLEESDSRTVTTSYATYSWTLTNNPFTDATWTVAEVNSTNFGVTKDGSNSNVLVTQLYLGVDYSEGEVPELDSDLSITCDAVDVDGDTWTMSGTWIANDFPGQDNQYDVAIFSPIGIVADSSSKDLPDLFSILTGPSNTTGGPQEDMAGTWSNQVIFGSVPSAISATLYHAAVPGNESSGDATCVFTLPSQCSNGVDDDEDGLTDFPDDLGCESPEDDDEFNEEPNIPPVINLDGDNPMDIIVGNTYVEPGATADDAEDGLGLLVSDITGIVNHLIIGIYEVFYNFTDTDGAPADEVVRTVNVNPGDTECSDGIDNDGDGLTDYPADAGCDDFSDDNENQPPVITVTGDNPLELIVNVGTYTEQGATADDAEDGNGLPVVDINDSEVDVSSVGSYTVYYNFTDSDGAVAEQKTRTVNVIAGGNECNDTLDNDGDGTVDYPEDSGCASLEDPSENEPPVITLTGSSPQVVTLNDSYLEQGATADDAEDGNSLPVTNIDSFDVDTSVLGNYIVYYNFTDSDGAAAAEVTRDVEVKTACTDGIDNDDDGLTDASDPGCWTNPNDSETYDPEDNNETDPADVCPNDEGIQTNEEQCTPEQPGPILGCMDPSATNFNSDATEDNGSCTYPEPETPPSGGGGSSRPPTPSDGGEVLGASTGEVLGEACGLYMDRFIRRGITNDVEQVTKLQTFLNKWMDSGLTINGTYDDATLQALRAFQEQYANEVLTPWGLTGPTGLVYQTTLRWINMLECPDLALTIPNLIPWSQNPNVPKVLVASVPATTPPSQPQPQSSAPTGPTSPEDEEPNDTEPQTQSATVIDSDSVGGFWDFLKSLFGR